MSTNRKALFASFRIPLTIEGILVVLIWFLIEQWGGHTALMLGGTLHLPSSFLGILVGEYIQRATGESEIASIVGIGLTVCTQIILVTYVFYFVLRKRPKYC